MALEDLVCSMVAWPHVLEQNMTMGAFDGGKLYFMAKQKMLAVAAFLCFSEHFHSVQPSPIRWCCPSLGWVLFSWLILSGTTLSDTLRGLPHQSPR